MRIEVVQNHPVVVQSDVKDCGTHDRRLSGVANADEVDDGVKVAVRTERVKSLDWKDALKIDDILPILHGSGSACEKG